MSSNQNGNFIARARQQIFDLQRKRALAKRHEKIEATKDKTEAELFLDDAAAEGLDAKNPAHLAIILRAWALRQGQTLEGDETDWDRSPERDLTF